MINVGVKGESWKVRPSIRKKEIGNKKKRGNSEKRDVRFEEDRGNRENADQQGQAKKNGAKLEK